MIYIVLINFLFGKLIVYFIHKFSQDKLDELEGSARIYFVATSHLRCTEYWWFNASFGYDEDGCLLSNL